MSMWQGPCPSPSSSIEPMHVRSPPSQRWQPTKAASCVVLRAPPIDLCFRRVCWSLLKIYQLRSYQKGWLPIRVGSLLFRTRSFGENVWNEVSSTRSDSLLLIPRSTSRIAYPSAGPSSRDSRRTSSEEVHRHGMTRYSNRRADKMIIDGEPRLSDSSGTETSLLSKCRRPY